MRNHRIVRTFDTGATGHLDVVGRLNSRAAPVVHRPLAHETKTAAQWRPGTGSAQTFGLLKQPCRCQKNRHRHPDMRRGMRIRLDGRNRGRTEVKWRTVRPGPARVPRRNFSSRLHRTSGKTNPFVASAPRRESHKMRRLTNILGNWARCQLHSMMLNRPAFRPRISTRCQVTLRQFYESSQPELFCADALTYRLPFKHKFGFL
jgi:hypothetical protein